MVTFQESGGSRDGQERDDRDPGELILDEGTNATAKCTAIRTLRELQGEERGETVYSDKFANLDEWRRLRDVKPRRGGPQGA